MTLQNDAAKTESAAAPHAWLQEAASDEALTPATPRKISIFGLGYVGAVSLACLARDGHEMTGVDIDEAKLEMLRRGQAPIVETGIQELTRSVIRRGNVTVTDSVRDAILATDVSFVCVGTPARSNGSQNLDAITRVAEQIGAVLADKSTRHVVVVRSTVKPGTVEEVIQPAIEAASGLKAGIDFSLCFQPEFLREGTSIHDYDHPPLTVVGASDAHGVAALRGIFGHLPCEFVHTSIRTAEMLKYACNTFHAVKVTFANEIGRICQAASVDPHEVMKLLCMDRQLNISPAYLRPGFAFGGSCLPKDLKALVYLAKSADIEVPMLASVMPSNTAHIEHAIEQVLASGKRRVGMLGLSFKAGTDDLRESPMVELTERLIGKGYDLKVYDKNVSLARLHGANRDYILNKIPHISRLMVDSIDEVLEHAQTIVIGNAAPEFAEVPRRISDGQTVIDFVRVSDSRTIAGVYEGICW